MRPSPLVWLFAVVAGLLVISVDSFSLEKQRFQKAKHQAPGENRTGDEEHEPPALGLGYFPSWRSPMCSNVSEPLAQDARLCDPEGLLQDGAYLNVSTALHNFGKRTTVVCGGLLPKLRRRDCDPWHQPFQLGIAVLEGHKLASHSTDVNTLQQLVNFIMARWDMMPSYNGVAVSSDDRLACPAAAALLIVLPDLQKAYLGSASCEYICADHGGAEVVLAVEEKLQEAGGLGETVGPEDLSAALESGIAAVAKVLNVTGAAPLSSVESEMTRNRRLLDWKRGWMDRIQRSGPFWIWSQRALFLGIMSFSIFVVVAYIYYGCIVSPRPDPRKV